VFRTVATFAVAVFAVWYLPAAEAAFAGKPGPRIAAMLAGVVVALPVTVLASIGALLVFLVGHSSVRVLAWQSVVAGILCGVITRVITRSPKAPSRALQIASQLWSPVPVLLRVILAGALVGLVMLAVGELQRTGGNG